MTEEEKKLLITIIKMGAMIRPRPLLFAFSMPGTCRVCGSHSLLDELGNWSPGVF
jgi:hypothetical protein